MSFIIRVEGSAQDELRAAVLWYDAQRPGLGVELLEEIERTFAILQAHPFIGGLVPYASESADVRRLLVRRFPFSIVYRVRNDELQIIALAHTSRKPGYWIGH